MSVIFHKDKRSGITYAYETKGYWDKEKKQARSHRTLIGRVNTDGQIIATDGRCRKNKDGVKYTRKRGPVPITQTARYFYGATYLFDEIGKMTGLTEDIKTCFPDMYKQILSIAYFLILDDNSSLMHFPHWAMSHQHPFDDIITSQRSSKLFASIDEEKTRHFFRLQGKRRIETEYWAYDSTSISSYSETLKQVKYGKNKENDLLPQINLLLIFGEQSGLPFYYRKLAGNIPDVTTVRTLLKELDILGYSNVKLVMDRGFYSEMNINQLFQYHEKFIMAARCTLAFVHERIKCWHETIKDLNCYDEASCLYYRSEIISWQYSQKRPYKKDLLTAKRRMYLHVFFNSEKAADQEKAFNAKLLKMQRELKNNECKKSHEKAYQKFFTVKKIRGKITVVAIKQDAVKTARECHGYFALVTNEIKDPIQALQIYRTKDVVEKAFGNIKERLNCRRLLVSSEASLNGKLFVEFLALIIISYIHKKMQVKELYKTYTMIELLDELELVQSFCEPGRAPIVGEVLKKQCDIYEALDIKPPLT